MARSTPVVFGAYNNYDEAGKITDKPIYSLVPGGILRSTTLRVFKKDAVYVAVLDLREADSRAQTHDLMERVAGVQLRYRAKNVASALVTFWYDGTDADCSAPRTITPSADGRWEELIVPITYPGKSGSSMRRILLKWKLTAAASTLEQPMVLDVSGVSFFVPGE